MLYLTLALRVIRGTIVLSQEQTELSKTIPLFRKKNDRIERVLKNVGTICKGTEIFEKSVLNQERVLNQEGILNEECVLNHLEIFERFFRFDHLNQPPLD